MKLKRCDAVRVVGWRKNAKVRAILTSMHGALLEKQLGGFRNWNVDELHFALLRFRFTNRHSTMGQMECQISGPSMCWEWHSAFGFSCGNFWHPRTQARNFAEYASKEFFSRLFRKMS